MSKTNNFYLLKCGKEGGCGLEGGLICIFRVVQLFILVILYIENPQ